MWLSAPQRTGRGLPRWWAGCFLPLQPLVLLSSYSSVASADPPVTPPPNSTLLPTQYVPTGANTVATSLQTRIHRSKLALAYTSHQLRRSAWPQRAGHPVRQRRYGPRLLQTVATHPYPAAEQAKQAQDAQGSNTQHGRRKDDYQIDWRASLQYI